MAKKEVKIETAGKVNWEKLEAQSTKKKRPLKEEQPDIEGIEHEKKNLTPYEKSLPYPEDFLADINLLRKKINVGKLHDTYTQKSDEQSLSSATSSAEKVPTSQKIGANTKARVVKKLKTT